VGGELMGFGPAVLPNWLSGWNVDAGAATLIAFGLGSLSAAAIWAARMERRMSSVEESVREMHEDSGRQESALGRIETGLGDVKRELSELRGFVAGREGKRAQSRAAGVSRR